MNRSGSSEFNTSITEVGNYSRIDSSDGAWPDNGQHTETLEKEEFEMKDTSRYKEFDKSRIEAEETKKLGQRKAQKRYKLKLYLTGIIIFSIISATWIIFILPLCIGAYAVFQSTFKGLPISDDNTTFLNTFSSSDSCLYNKTEALARLHIHSTWLQLTYSNQSVSALNSSYGIMVKNTTCVPMFINNGTQCTPECFAFVLGGETYIIAWRVFIFAGASISFVASLVGIVTWVKLGGKLWDFPQIIFFYMTCTVLVQSTCIMSGQVAPRGFFCKHSSLIDSQADSTIICHIQGAIFHYSLMAFLYWYLIAVINLLYIITIPFSGANNFQVYKRRIHLFESVFCWGFPLLVLIVTIAVTKGYTFSNLPAFCIPNDLFIVITLHFPGVILCLFNGTAIPIVVGIMLKRHYLLTKIIGRGIVGLAWIVQLAAFTVAFSVSAWLVMFNFTLQRFNLPRYYASLDHYSRCVTMFGVSGTECCRLESQSHFKHISALISGFSSSVWGVAALSIGMSGGVKRFWKTVFTCNKVLS